ncbi:uncharacterized protein [Oscarella lobularis]|uniref:uncharacterized protein n=1 Tax=Oscarella lobularis TaxID=121494 RepID=UPI0033131FFE
MTRFLFVCFFLLALVASKKLKELKIEVIENSPSCDERTASGDTISVHYTGKLTNGREFDSSLREGRGPFTFPLGKGQVIKGWDQGLLDMCVGEKRRLTVPPHLAYGSTGHPPVIPPDSILVFETELLAIEKKSVIDSLTSNYSPTTLVFFVLFGMTIYYVYVQLTTKGKEISGGHKGGSRKKKRGR